MAEGETQYNIPVSSKQLIVYFVFLVIALTAAFLAGVMVGRNADSSPEPAVRDIQDDRLPEEPTPTPTSGALTYGSTLQTDKIEGLSPSPRPAATPAPSLSATPTPRPAPAAATTTGPIAAPPRSTASPGRPRSIATPTPRPQPRATPKPSPSTKGSRAVPAPGNRLTIQVGAFKERATAETIVKRLKDKGYSAYLVPVSEGLFNVRVGSFVDREDAERIMGRLESQERFKPFIVKP